MSAKDCRCTSIANPRVGFYVGTMHSHLCNSCTCFHSKQHSRLALGCRYRSVRKRVAVLWRDEMKVPNEVPEWLGALQPFLLVSLFVLLISPGSLYDISVAHHVPGHDALIPAVVL
ncbi:hypothetical protein Micbo1qcDRAFT_30943 [Microdochium bolleyi]|uniref:Uncharacterized protein n=1 Tax=Microdochium bolleyi TaxID=196109 RepID=A0A136JG23_9PEZI|nr:hypothetical protein Micbo1qcDRAFT_30943 [Microdochium bolleyi]